MAEQRDVVDVVPFSSEQFHLMSQRLEKVASPLESAAQVAPHPREPRYFKLPGSITDSLMTFHRQLAGIHDVFSQTF